MGPETTSLQATCAEAQQSVLDAIPEKWRIDAATFKINTNSTAVPGECGLMSPKQLELTELTASELLARLHTGEVSAYEVTEAFCIRSAIAQQMINCLTAFFPDEALEAAKTLDRHFEKHKKPVGLLHGLPIAIKDMMSLKGKRATMGYASWYDNICEKDAFLVTQMKELGVVIFAKTTMPQTGMALESCSNLWGRTLNPHNSNFGSGGSSGGDGALVAMRGVPCAPLTSDIGGSIRAPAAFNGNYAIRPTYDRIPRAGLLSTVTGCVSIKTSIGPNTRSMEDLKMLTKIILTHPLNPFEPSCVPGFWSEAPRKPRLRVGVMSTDGVVEPHPPIRRALKETAQKLEAAGHDVFDFGNPLDLWRVAETTWALYYQTGAVEIKAALAASGESPIATFQRNLDVFKTKPLTTKELFRHNSDQLAYKYALAEAWDASQMDVLLCPCAPMAGVPHSFPVWWGYTTLWNILDYPSIVMPIRDFRTSPEKDPKSTSYTPQDNPFDRDNWGIYDPELWSTQPMTLQVVARYFRDEELISACETIDAVVNPPAK